MPCLPVDHGFSFGSVRTSSPTILAVLSLPSAIRAPKPIGTGDKPLRWTARVRGTWLAPLPTALRRMCQRSAARRLRAFGLVTHAAERVAGPTTDSKKGNAHTRAYRTEGAG